jgi:hypothetical protein
MKKKLLVISAHSADFIWRAGGTIAKSVEQGAEILVVAFLTENVANRANCGKKIQIVQKKV